ncbi:hypothetical protein D9M71_814680 [compost metagenome]
MSDQNNPNTINGIRKKIRAMADSKNLARVQFDHAHQLGWIGALYWANVLDRAMHDQLVAEVVDALTAWRQPKANDL